MTSDLCTDDVVVHISGPQIISAESPVSTCAGVSVSGAGVRGGGAGGGAELGRRLLVAARAGDTRAVLDLMAKGAPFTTDWLGTSALHLAAGAGHAETCAVLVRAAVSRDARTKVERTPLHLAAYAGHTAVVELLLDYGAAIDCRDMLRMTPLQWAAARGHAGAASALARRGADLTLTDKFGHTARALAARAGHHHVARALDEAARAREAQRSVRALVADQMPDTNTTEAQLRTFESVQKVADESNIKINKSQQQERLTSIKTEPVMEGRAGRAECEGAAAQLLRAHGITLLPADHSSTVLNAIQSGRTVVLSDAGKLMLKESDELPPLSKASASVSSAPSVSAAQKGVVLTATPVKSPPKPGVKVFTLNNKLPVKKIINPQDLQQVKFVQLPTDTKIISPVKTIPMKAKSKTGRPAVKIIMNKANFNKLLANATTTLVPDQAADTITVKSSSGSSGESAVAASAANVASVASVCGVRDVCALSAEFVSRCGAPALRALLTRSLAELRAARQALADLRAATQPR